VKHAISTSAVIASFNHELYIEEAIWGIIGQVDELVVVDDQSTDKTLEILSALSNAHESIKVLTPNRKLGVSGAYNLAVKEAKHDLIVMQGADDISVTGRVSAQVEALSNPANILCHSLPLVINKFSHRLPNESAPEFFRSPEYESPLSELFFNGNFICAPSVSMRKRDFLKLGGFPKNIDALQDFALWLKCAAVGDLNLLDFPIVQYRKHGNNLSRRDFSERSTMNRSSRELLFILEEFLSNTSPIALHELLRVAMQQNHTKISDIELMKIFIKLSHVNLDFRVGAINDLFVYSQGLCESNGELRKISELITRVLSSSNIRISPFELNHLMAPNE
jgi:glycosyltransferase involved in cell wall biosynthesis